MKKLDTEVIMAKYKKCERCELNWIPVEEDLCEVCKAELGKESKIQLIDEDDENIFNERVCPICKENYLEEGEDICPACRHEKEKLKEKSEDNWQFEDDDIIDDDVEELSLNALQEEEIDEDFDDEEEFREDLDDFDESFEEIGEIDFDEDEEDDEDEDFD
ncbi:MAG: hypothetical protein J6V77_02565 [Clostridia bacterium]|nr:hypothetical protein [Clostridia bacterium]